MQRKKCQRDTNLIDLIGIEVESATVSNPISVQHSVFDSFAVATSGSVPDSVIDYIQGTADEMMPAPVSSIEPASISDSFMDSIPIPIDNWQ